MTEHKRGGSGSFSTPVASYSYWMKVGDSRFTLSEHQYLSQFKKGSFVEFYQAPHSKLRLSFPVEVRE
jgi:hypothetical protein